MHVNHDAPYGSHTRVRSPAKTPSLMPITVGLHGGADCEHCAAMRNNRCDALGARRKAVAPHTESNAAR